MQGLGIPVEPGMIKLSLLIGRLKMEPMSTVCARRGKVSFFSILPYYFSSILRRRLGGVVDEGILGARIGTGPSLSPTTLVSVPHPIVANEPRMDSRPSFVAMDLAGVTYR